MTLPRAFNVLSKKYVKLIEAVTLLQNGNPEKFSGRLGSQVLS
jgi:hypothetical protein